MSPYITGINASVLRTQLIKNEISNSTILSKEQKDDLLHGSLFAVRVTKTDLTIKSTMINQLILSYDAPKLDEKIKEIRIKYTDSKTDNTLKNK